MKINHHFGKLADGRNLLSVPASPNKRIIYADGEKLCEITRYGKRMWRSPDGFIGDRIRAVILGWVDRLSVK